MEEKNQHTIAPIVVAPTRQAGGMIPIIILTVIVIIIMMLVAGKKDDKDGNSDNDSKASHFIDTLLGGLPGLAQSLNDLIQNRMTEPGRNPFLNEGLNSLHAAYAAGDVESVGNRNRSFKKKTLTVSGVSHALTLEGQSYKVKKGGTVYTHVLAEIHPAVKLLRFGLEPLTISHIEKIYIGKMEATARSIDREFKDPYLRPIKSYTKFSDFLHELTLSSGWGLNPSDPAVIELKETGQGGWIPDSFITSGSSTRELPIMKADEPNGGFYKKVINVDTQKVRDVKAISDNYKETVSYYSLWGPQLQKDKFDLIMKVGRDNLNNN